MGVGGCVGVGVGVHILHMNFNKQLCIQLIFVNRPPLYPPKPCNLPHFPSTNIMYKYQ